MKRSEHRILTTHVGSIVRPSELLELSAAARQGGDQKRHHAQLKQSVAGVVQMQAKAGIDVVNDGEFGKSGWANYVLARLSGFEERPQTMYPEVWLGRDREGFHNFNATAFYSGGDTTPGHGVY